MVKQNLFCIFYSLFIHFVFILLRSVHIFCLHTFEKCSCILSSYSWEVSKDHDTHCLFNNCFALVSYLQLRKIYYRNDSSLIWCSSQQQLCALVLEVSLTLMISLDLHTFLNIVSENNKSVLNTLTKVFIPYISINNLSSQFQFKHYLCYLACEEGLQP